MYQRLSAVLFPIAAVLLAGTVLWGYQEHQEKNRILVKAENQYQRAFHDLSYHMDQLHEELGNTLAVSSRSNFHRKGLINLWRLTSQAQSEVNQLPLTLMPFHETESLLANIAAFTYKTAMRDLAKQPLSDQEMKVLTTLYERSKEIKNDLRKVQEAVLEKHLLWMDVEMLLASGEEAQDNDIIDGFKLMNKKVGEYGDLDWGPSVTAMNRRMAMKSVEGEPIAPEEAAALAAKFFGAPDPGALQVAENGKDTDFATYTVQLPASGGSGGKQVEYTKRGGRLVYFLAERDVAETRIDIGEAADAGKEFLARHGFGEMKAVGYDAYNNVASIMYARTVDGVTIYPDKTTVKVALDDGEILGLSAAELLRSGPRREIGRPAMSEEQAREYLNPNFRVEEASPALILNDMEEEVLCWEFVGGINGGKYRIYLNADNGFEEKIERIRDSDAAGG